MAIRRFSVSNAIIKTAGTVQMNKVKKMNRFYAVTFLFASLFLGAMQAEAQVASDTLSATVSRVQSRGIYLEISSSMFVAGDTVWVVQKSGLETAGKVAGKASNSLLLAWIAEPANVQVGEHVLLRGPHHIILEGDQGPEVTEVEKKSILGEAVSTGSALKKNLIILRGYYNASITASFSNIRGQFTSNRSSSRSYTTPVSSVRAILSGLPLGTEIQVSLRGSSRFSSEEIVGQASSIRVYEFNVARHLRTSRFEFDLGRFQSSQVASSGYWDGFSTSYRFGGLKVGASAGFEPDRYNESFQTDITKISAFSELETRHSGGSTSIVAAVTQIDSPGLSSPYYFMTLNQRTRLGQVRFSTDLQVDQSPIDKSITLSRLYVRASTRLSPGLSFNTRYGTRRHFSYWYPGGSYSSEKQQISAGLLLQRAVNQYGLTLTSNSFSGKDRSNSISASFRTRPSWLPFRVSNTTNVWTRKSGNTYYNSINLQKEIGRFSLGLDYSLLALDALGPMEFSHIAGASIRISTARWGNFSIRQRTHIGSSISSATLFFNYGISF